MLTTRSMSFNFSRFVCSAINFSRGSVLSDRNTEKTLHKFTFKSLSAGKFSNFKGQGLCKFKRSIT